jgi:hypothetical protein
VRGDTIDDESVLECQQWTWTAEGRDFDQDEEFLVGGSKFERCTGSRRLISGGIDDVCCVIFVEAA